MAARQWRPTGALRRSVTIVAVALLAAVGMGRVDLVVLATPLALGVLASIWVRPRVAPSAEIVVAEDRVPETDEFNAWVRVANPDPVPTVSVVATREPAWLRLRHGVGFYVRAVAANGEATVSLRGVARRWGRHEIGPALVRSYACDGLLRTADLMLPARGIRVYPTADVFDSRQELPRAAGMTGIHRTRRHGDGGELAEVRPFQPGDRLRRIDWRVSLRRREPYVNSTLSERDAEVVIVIDVLHEAGNPGETSILDVTVRAAAAIAEHYTRQGDRVSVVEFGSGLRRLRPGTGRRQFRAVLEWLTDTRVTLGPYAGAERLASGGYLPFGSVVIMLTPLIDEQSTELLARLTRSGRTLVTVDTLPDALRPPHRSPWSGIAARLWRQERRNTVDRLRELGVPVERWRGPGSLDLMLGDIARLGRAPKVTRR
ncbi:DUF58 domain-containing protein [Stackebrandtia nassauensis]|uniref:DUF58 domain-containing protein n=1 Tax=Stackebrandtia nassauensis (strain DSM 44728 / CIP 108903 / NRRL B-16338 / NBRC 102104 / LLR-40K-21) TaxID=446470 RepID=D3PWD6_STANL|nr:DUF58 domain-containing protein [Stackebrandtia nassauensis]ADD41293.1 protein of unknown function DUF58 [Stackebrandtia nassauensis DSM 44728]